MSLPVILDPESQAEFDEGYDYYQTKRLGLGEDFADAVETVLDRIGRMPNIHGRVLGDVRKAVVRRFPYCVYYRSEADRVRVIAIFHTSRNPDEWKKRV